MRLSAALVCLAALAVSVLAAPYWSLSGSYEPTCENWRTVKAAYDDIMSHDAVKHRVRNNYKITSSYHRIGTLFSKLVGLWNVDPLSGESHSSRNATVTHGNWPSLAVWASNSVGFGIRSKMISFDVAAILKAIDKAYPHLIPSAVEADIKRLVNLVESVIMRGTFTKTSEALGKGNRAVFDEIGSFYTSYALLFCDQPSYEVALVRFKKFVQTLDYKSQESMIKAFGAVFQAHYATDRNPLLLSDADAAWLSALAATGSAVDAAGYIGAAAPGRRLSVKERAELMLFANMMVGFQEQTNLQDAIESSIPGPSVIPWGGKNITIYWGHIFTQFLMTLQWGPETLFVGQDVPKRATDKAFFGPELSMLTVNSTAAAYYEMGGHASDLKGSAAKDWTSLEHRMRYIAPLFRSRQDVLSLTCQPFSAKQHQALWTESSAVPENDSICLEDCCEKNGRPE